MIKRDKAGHILCNKCEHESGVGMIIRHKVYCMKCAEIIKGERDETGYKSPDLPTNKILVEEG